MSEDIKNLFIIQNSEKHVSPKYFIHPNAVVHYSIISKENIDVIKKNSKFKIVTREDFVNKDDVTHLIVGKTEEVSIKILYAILKGIFVVEESCKCMYFYVYVLYFVFCFVGIPHYIKTDNKTLAFSFLEKKLQETYEKSIFNNLQKFPRLFDGMNFHILDHNKPYKIYNMEFKKQDLVKLIEVGGGKQLHRAPALRTVEGTFFYPFHIDRNSDLTTCTNYIIYQENQPPQLLYNMKELRHKSSKWLIDCILNFSIITKNITL